MIYTVRRDPTNREVQITFEVVAKPSNRQTSTPIEKSKKKSKIPKVWGVSMGHSKSRVPDGDLRTESSTYCLGQLMGKACDVKRVG